MSKTYTIEVSDEVAEAISEITEALRFVVPEITAEWFAAVAVSSQAVALLDPEMRDTMLRGYAETLRRYGLSLDWIPAVAAEHSDAAERVMSVAKHEMDGVLADCERPPEN
jgi:hypothetical protein